MEWFIIFQNLTEGGGESWFAQAEEDPYCPSLSKKQRIIGKNFKGTSPAQIDVKTIIFCPNHYTFLGFMGCMAMGILCFSMAAAYLPVLVIAARKFALLYTLGSIFFISSFSLLYGPKKHFKECQKHTFKIWLQKSNFCLYLSKFSTKKCILTQKSISFQQNGCHLHHHTFVQCFSPFMLLLESNLICWQ